MCNDDSIYSVFRRFSEFAEFNQKLLNASFNELPKFPAKIFVGRSHTRQVRYPYSAHLAVVDVDSVNRSLRSD